MFGRLQGWLAVETSWKSPMHPLNLTVNFPLICLSCESPFLGSRRRDLSLPSSGSFVWFNSPINQQQTHSISERFVATLLTHMLKHMMQQFRKHPSLCPLGMRGLAMLQALRHCLLCFTSRGQCCSASASGRLKSLMLLRHLKNRNGKS